VGLFPRDTNPFPFNRINVVGWFATPHQLGLAILLRRA